MPELVTSVRLRPVGAHVQVTVFVNHAFCGNLTMRPQEADEFRALLVRAERVEAALIELVRRAGDPTLYQGAKGAWIMLGSALSGAEAALRFVCPEAVGGLYSTEELGGDAD